MTVVVPRRDDVLIKKDGTPTLLFATFIESLTSDQENLDLAQIIAQVQGIIAGFRAEFLDRDLENAPLFPTGGNNKTEKRIDDLEALLKSVLARRGTNSGDVTLAGPFDYLTILGQVITLNAIDLDTDITNANTAFNVDFGLVAGTVLEGDTAPADIGAEPADATILKDADIGGSVQAFSADLDTYAANPLTAGELAQLQNIDSVTITNAQWAFLGAFDQGLATTSTVTFAQLTTSGKIIVDDTTDATTIDDGSIQSDGGIAAKKNIISGGEIIVKPASSFGAALVLESPTTAFSSIVKFKHAGTFFGDIGMVASSGIVTYNAGLTVGFLASHLFKVDTVGKLKLDSTAIAGDTAMLIFDVNNAALARVTVGAANSGGAGFKVLRIPN